MDRVRFPTTVHADAATFDIQYGFIRRPTHRNTSWDLARFEVFAHRYVDLSDGDGGVALLNDCKYGHKVMDNVIDLNLLRSPTDPDPDADQGKQVFVYSLLPHTEPFGQSAVMEQASMLNQPPLCLPGFTLGETTPGFPLNLEGAGVTLAVLKRAEDDDRWLIRLV